MADRGVSRPGTFNQDAPDLRGRGRSTARDTGRAQSALRRPRAGDGRGDERPLALQGAPLHGVVNGRPNGRNVERFVEIIARAQSQCLTHRFGGLESGQHYHLDGRIHKFQPLEHFDSGHPRHSDVEHGHIYLLILRELDRCRAVGRKQDIEFILKDDAQRLARAIFIIND